MIEKPEPQNEELVASRVESSWEQYGKYVE